jgi:hypothetical protein
MHLPEWKFEAGILYILAAIIGERANFHFFFTRHEE